MKPTSSNRLFVDKSDAAAIIAGKDAEIERLANERDADRFRFLQNIPAEQAQAFFWNYQSRQQRAKANCNAF